MGDQVPLPQGAHGAVPGVAAVVPSEQAEQAVALASLE